MLSSLMNTKLWRQVHLQNSLGELQLAAETHCGKCLGRWDTSASGKEQGMTPLTAKQMILRMRDYL